MILDASLAFHRSMVEMTLIILIIMAIIIVIIIPMQLNKVVKIMENLRKAKPKVLKTKYLDKKPNIVLQTQRS